MTGLRRHLRRLAAAVAAAALLAACGGEGQPASTTAPSTTSTSTTTTTTRPAPLTTTSTTLPASIPLRIGVTLSLAYGIPFVLADPATGIAAANSLDITVEVFATPEEALAAAVAGEVDVALPNARAALTALAGGACFLAPLDFIDEDTMRLVGRSDLITADDLIGRKVGTVAGSEAEVALRMWLSDEGVAWDEVEVVDTAALDLVTALTGGAVDAVIWNEPVPGQALAACGEEACRYIGEVGESYRQVAPVDVTCRWQQEHGADGMTRVVRAWLEGKEYVRNNLEAAAAITADRLRLTAEEVATRWQDRGWLQVWGANLTDRQLEMLEAYGAYLVAAGELVTAPAVCSWVNSDWLASVAPSLVSLDEYDC
jgi:ABC-type nitrate/sulfonate/bicarbonate transport system substrate-binding protein